MYNDTNWYLGGRIDGITKDNTIVEVKNRMYRLFYKVRDYENVQIHSYMYLLKTQKSHLVEFLNKSKNKKINVVEIDYNKNYWENKILPKIISFIYFFESFINKGKIDGPEVENIFTILFE